MKKRSLGFIGGGRITKILLKAFQNAGATFNAVNVFDTNQETASALKKQFPEIRIADTLEVASLQDVVFIALHPPVIMETLGLLKSYLRADATLISLAPKISFEKIRSAINNRNILRLIPSATSWMNEGYNPVCYSEDFEEQEKLSIGNMLGLLGYTFEVDEHKLEGYALVSAMLPTYFWFQWNELVEIGIQTGLDQAESEKAVHESLKPALDLMFNSDLSYPELTDLIPVKPIGDRETEIRQIYQEKLMGLYQKIKP